MKLQHLPSILKHFSCVKVKRWNWYIFYLSVNNGRTDSNLWKKQDSCKASRIKMVFRFIHISYKKNSILIPSIHNIVGLSLIGNVDLLLCLFRYKRMTLSKYLISLKQYTISTFHHNNVCAAATGYKSLRRHKYFQRCILFVTATSDSQKDTLDIILSYKYYILNTTRTLVSYGCKYSK